MSTTADELREEVRRRYAESAGAVTQGTGGDCGCGSGSCCADGESDATMFGGALYELRWVRGTHGGQFVADPQGTDELPSGHEPPPDWRPPAVYRPSRY